ncbi:MULTISPECIES: DUF2264 domain-containing protein [Rhizobium]|uniref:DUF2264 domain-containing protein n=1 Tax=Rhizobium TaxID=379 RepID=UPI0007EBBD62|nr:MULTISPECIES: DUF2264 domain-containing protein [Rhizobium]ANK95295.1 hypothetical protein AMK01_PD00416 [Rhizobium sp. N6212]ANL01348.1 hypothetical protein AMK00_PD00415 [Rhizobium sp. N621]ANL07471.1 hypothetical protein AMJ99_PD00417 [Rhizobium esperanzae]ANL13641.1 hypothetical protein AMJ98_PE00417 [Rhizobium sp. N1341]ANL25625.1 hypothetical protein AMJ96_PD00422 [Rhizobium sp. N113]
MIYDPTKANPLSGNPLKTRDDLAKAVIDLFRPLLPYFSEGGARVRLSATGAIFDRAAADLEGFARPLWGIVPLAAGGRHFPHWNLYRRGLANGTNPAHPEYWGDLADRNQRLVELAAVGFALALVPEHIWEPLSDGEKRTVAAYLLAARELEFIDNNWKFFRILIDLGLQRVGVAFDMAKTAAYLDELEAFDIGEGWYRDGPVRRVDHYIPFAMHFYGLIYTLLARGDEARKNRFRNRAEIFARDIRHWFGPDGAALAFGRSQTYRFAAGGFWGALAFAGVEALPWAEIKGYYMRHIRWWSAMPIADRDGVLSIGYGYPNLLMSESYNSPGSPYWALKFFLPLALPQDHPFWTAEEAQQPDFPKPVALKSAGMVAMHTPGNVVVLSSGQQHDKMRGANEKYSKFVYSTRYAFNIEADDRNFSAASFDGMLGLSDDGVHFRMRETMEEALIAGDRLYSRWRPWNDVNIETWLLPANPWHIRIHRIATPRSLSTIEGGFAIERADFNADRSEQAEGRAVWYGQTDVSAIVDLSLHPRTGHAMSPIPNTNLIHAKTLLPQLRGEIGPGTTLLVTAVLALPVQENWVQALENPPAGPDLDELERYFREKGVPVPAFALQQ